jgi:hypothetical protein
MEKEILAVLKDMAGSLEWMMIALFAIAIAQCAS